jgi:hypothetical protein
MPDFAMCQNHDCPSAKRCWRHEAPPAPQWQSWSVFSPDESGKCGYFKQTEARRDEHETEHG